jgi:hypothetical protein
MLYRFVSNFFNSQCALSVRFRGVWDGQIRNIQLTPNANFRIEKYAFENPFHLGLPHNRQGGAFFSHIRIVARFIIIPHVKKAGYCKAKQPLPRDHHQAR